MLTFKEMIDKVLKDSGDKDKIKELTKKLKKFGFKKENSGDKGLIRLKLPDNPFNIYLRVEIWVVGTVLVWEYNRIGATKVFYLDNYTVDEITHEICEFVKSKIPNLEGAQNVNVQRNDK